MMLALVLDVRFEIDSETFTFDFTLYQTTFDLNTFTSDAVNKRNDVHLIILDTKYTLHFATT